jgi:hypothetical protein
MLPKVVGESATGVERQEGIHSRLKSCLRGCVALGTVEEALAEELPMQSIGAIRMVGVRSKGGMMALERGMTRVAVSVSGIARVGVARMALRLDGVHVRSGVALASQIPTPAAMHAITLPGSDTSRLSQVMAHESHATPTRKLITLTIMGQAVVSMRLLTLMMNMSAGAKAGGGSSAVVNELRRNKRVLECLVSEKSDSAGG